VVSGVRLALATSMIAAVLLIAPATTMTAQDGGPALAEGDYVVVAGESAQLRQGRVPVHLRDGRPTGGR
jgi:hypothetical protein